MPPMIDKETGSYLRHHVALAGRDDTLFSDDAVTLFIRPDSARRRVTRTPG
jgi:type II secretory pathway predicted ATPase ExeA